MEELDALAAQHAELAGVVEALTDDEWARPADRCPGWSVSDVLLHLAHTDELAIASVEGRLPEVASALTRGGGRGETVDDAADVMVRLERDSQTPTQVRDRWATAARELESALATCDPHARLQWVAGTLSARTLATTRIAETWIHTGDIADALGVRLEPDERLRHVARLAWRTLPYAFERAGRTLTGPVVFDLVGPTGEPWRFGVGEGEGEGDAPRTTIEGEGVELCLVAARRVDAGDTSLRGTGPDATAVLELVRTYA